MSGILDWITPGVGSIIGGVVSAFGQSRANKETKNYLTAMSNTGYQRSMADMKAAGLNPMLAAKLGPASTPNYQAGNVGGAAVQGFNQASSAFSNMEKADLTATQNEVLSGSPQAVASRIIKAIEVGLTGGSVSGPYGMFADLASEVVTNSKQYKVTTGPGVMQPKLNGKLVAAVVGKAGDLGIEFGEEVINKLMEKVFSK